MGKFCTAQHVLLKNVALCQLNNFLNKPQTLHYPYVRMNNDLSIVTSVFMAV